MRIFFLFLFVVSFSFSVQAQFETSKRKLNIAPLPPPKIQKKKNITPENNPTVVAPAIKFESTYFKNQEDPFLRGLPELPKVGETPDKTYALKSASEVYTEKFNEKLKEDGISPELYNRNISWGQFVVYTEGITIGARDFGAIDGDLVRIWLNGQLVTSQIYLENDFKNISLQLNKGLNVIEVEALNYGELSPNTGQFNFFDGNKELITVQYWNLGIGYRAKILVEYKDKILKKIDEK
ncbi:hypothetical protein OX283_013940 [Flavobacterium sp. SUN052]|uniref:hypothetical protein n=1 Tax=Flavobacterium sp. SUN052 TaxID=3002441 RepID=UPI00237D9FFE|nr:hypothetical protein [Flavobacterium sp. SUN052]MEC4005768.1 hypothetical protein [Flavobacterium sp. SUN052]